MSSRRRVPGTLPIRAVVLVLALSATACGPRRTVQWVNPQNTAPAAPRTTVLMMPLGPKSQAEMPYWISEDQRLVEAYFDIFMRHGFGWQTAARVTVADESFQTDALTLELRSVEQDGDPDFERYVPVAGSVIYEGAQPEFVLIFDGLDFSIEGGGGGGRQSYDVQSRGKVQVDLEYILWDNRNQEIAALGRLHKEMYTNALSPPNELFKSIFEEMADQIVSNSPLLPVGAGS